MSTSGNSWSSGPPKTLFKGKTMENSNSSANVPNKVPGGINLKIGNFKGRVPTPTAKVGLRVPTVQSANIARPAQRPTRPGLELVRTPRGMMPRCVAEKVFGPGGNQGIVQQSPAGIGGNGWGARPRMNMQNGWGGLNMSSPRGPRGMNMPTGGIGIRPFGQRNSFTGGFRGPRPGMPRWNGMVQNNNVMGATNGTFTGPAQPQQAAQQDNSKKEWPPGLTEYIQRSFAKCKNDTEKDASEKYLKTLINDKIKDGSAWRTNWQMEPLVIDKINNPLQPINEGKAQALKRTAELLQVRKQQNSYGGLNMIQPVVTQPLSKKGRWGDLPNKTNSLDPFSGSSFRIPDYLSTAKKNSRANRFGNENAKFIAQNFSKGSTSTFTLNMTLDNFDIQNFKITGTSTDIYKPYLRLTCAPDPSQVRTDQTLKKTLMALKQKWKNGVKDVEAYRFICDQLKSLRQDLTVQAIRNEFTVEVYENHCRIALDAGDHEEFNQCKSQLNQLYHAGICSEHRADITAYELVYYMLTKNMTDMAVALQKLDSDLKENPKIKLALKLRQAWSRDNYYRFFRLYDQADIGIRALVEKFIGTQRKRSLSIMMRSYKPSIPVSLVQRSLGFKLSEDDAHSFLVDSGATVKNDAVCTKTPLVDLTTTK